MTAESILQPVFAMVLLTFGIALWMLFTRIPSMMRLKVHPQKGQDAYKLRELLPHEVNRVANNYNHLFEQPVLFYVLCISVAILEQADTTFVACAWGYVALRVAHTIAQAKFDIVIARFYIFIASWVPLYIMAFKLALLLI